MALMEMSLLWHFKDRINGSLLLVKMAPLRYSTSKDRGIKDNLIMEES